MRVPDAVPSVGLQIDDFSPGPPVGKAGVPSGVGHPAAPALADSDHLARGTAPTPDSASYDTDNDFQHTLLVAAKAFALTSPQSHPTGISHPHGDSVKRQHGPISLLCQPFRTAFSGGGEGPQPPSLPNLLDILRHGFVVAWRALLRFRTAALQAPIELDTRATPGGVFRTLLFRQIPLHHTAWEAYSDLVAEQQRRPNGAADRPSIFGLPLLHPRCGIALVWAGAMLLFDCVFTAFLVPVNVAFCLEQYGKLEAPCTRTDLAGGIIYLLNILLNLQIGVTLTHGYRSRVVMDGLDTARMFVSSPSFWVDVSAVVPLVYLLIILAGGFSPSHHQTISIVSLMRLVRLFRVASIIKHLYASSSGGDVPTSWLADHFSVSPLYMVLLVYLAMVLVNLYACALLLLAHYQHLDGKGSWMMSAAGWHDLGPGGHTSGPRRWYHAVYYVITVMTTTGYADFLPRSPGEQVMACVMMLNGLLIFGAMVALIGNVLKRSQEQAQALHDTRKKLTRIRNWLEGGHVPEGVQRDVIMFFAELGVMRGGGATEGDIVFELPGYLRQKVVRHVVQDPLSRCAPLSSLPSEVCELMAAHCVPVDLPTGHELFRLGEEAEGGMWLLEEGAVCAARYQERMEAPAGPTGIAVPCLLGQGALLADAVRACGCRLWTVHTERPCRVWHLRGPAMRAVLQVYPYIVNHYMSYVKSRILAWLAGQLDREEDGWCEVVQLLKRSFLMGPLRNRITVCYLALQLASPHDGTLPQLLNAWLDMTVCQELVVGEQHPDGDERTSVHSVNEVLAMAASRQPTTVNGGDGADGVAAAHPTLTPAATPRSQSISPAAFDTNAVHSCEEGPGGSDGSGSLVLVDGDNPVATGFELYVGHGTLTSSSMRGDDGRLTTSGPATPAPTPPLSPNGSSQGKDGVLLGGGQEGDGEGAVEEVLNHVGDGDVSVISAALGQQRRRLMSDSGPLGAHGQEHGVGRFAQSTTSENGTETGNRAVRRGGARLHMTYDDVIAAAAATLRATMSVSGGVPVEAVDANDGDANRDPNSAPAAIHADSNHLELTFKSSQSTSLLDPSVADAATAVVAAAANAGGGPRRRTGLVRTASEGRQHFTVGIGAVSLNTHLGSSGGGGGGLLSAHTAPVGLPGGGFENEGVGDGGYYGARGGRISPPSPASLVLHRTLSPVLPARNGAGGRSGGVPSGVLLSPSRAGSARERELEEALGAAALVRPNSLGHTTFLQKIFLAAGVVLEPTGVHRPPSSLALPAGNLGGGGGGPSGPGTANGLTITAPACSTCGCATCAYCARPIVPQNALAVMQPIVRPLTKADQAPSGTLLTGTVSTATAASPASAVRPELRRIYSAGGVGADTASSGPMFPGRVGSMSPGRRGLGVRGGRGGAWGRGFPAEGPLLRMRSKPLPSSQPMYTQHLLMRSGSGGGLETRGARGGYASRFGDSGGGGGAVLLSGDGIPNGRGGGSHVSGRPNAGPLSPGASLAARAAAVSEPNANLQMGPLSGTMGII